MPWRSLRHGIAALGIPDHRYLVTKIAGVGLGLRYDLADELLEQKPDSIAFVEIHPENYMLRGGRYESMLEEAQKHWPVVTHGLTMCFGALEPFENQYLCDLKDILKRVEAPWHSDHLCFGGAHGVFAHDLLPIPFTDEAVELTVQRLTEARDSLDVPLALENVSYYAPQSDDGLEEVEFVREVLERADAKLLFDVNNVYVNAKNFGFDPKAYVDRVPVERVVEIHMAGHFIRDDELRIDTHGEAICDEVYELLEYALHRIGPVPVLLERDNNAPPLSELLAEVDRLNEIYARATGGKHAA